MPRGIKETSGLLSISFEIDESAANTFTTKTIDLQLDPLNNEVFVVYAIDLDLQEGDSVDGVDSVIRGSLSNVPRTSVGTLADSNVLATERMVIQNQTTNAVMTTFSSGAAHPATQLEYLGIIYTNDFSLQIQGTNQANPKSMFGKIYGVRGKADSSIYAAGVQSELLS